MTISRDLFRANVAASVSGLGDPFVTAAGPGGQVAGEVLTAIPADIIRLDGGAQMRAALDPATIRAYADRMLAGDQFPAVTVTYDGVSYWIADGFHRLAALGLLAGETGDRWWRMVNVRVLPGDARSAILLAAGANASHGLPRKPEDKRRAVAALLMDPEWLQWSDNEIARACAVSVPFVGKMRRELHGGAGEQTGGEVRRGADGRLISVANIGRVAASASPARGVAWSPGAGEQTGGEAGQGDAAKMAALLSTGQDQTIEIGGVQATISIVRAGGGLHLGDVRPGYESTIAAGAVGVVGPGEVAGVERFEIPIRFVNASPVVGLADFERVIDSGLVAALGQAVDFGRRGLFADGRGAAAWSALPLSVGEDLQTAAAALAIAAGRALACLRSAAAVAGVDLDGGGEVAS